jgi:hypothetical protein
MNLQTKEEWKEEIERMIEGEEKVFTGYIPTELAKVLIWDTTIRPPSMSYNNVGNKDNLHPSGFLNLDKSGKGSKDSSGTYSRRASMMPSKQQKISVMNKRMASLDTSKPEHKHNSKKLYRWKAKIAEMTFKHPNKKHNDDGLFQKSIRKPEKDETKHKLIASSSQNNIGHEIQKLSKVMRVF